MPRAQREQRSEAADAAAGDEHFEIVNPPHSRLPFEGMSQQP